MELPKLRSRDPGDDYLIALAAARGAMLVTGDSDLLALRESAPIRSPREALETLAETGRDGAAHPPMGRRSSRQAAAGAAFRDP